MQVPLIHDGGKGSGIGKGFEEFAGGATEKTGTFNPVDRNCTDKRGEVCVFN